MEIITGYTGENHVTSMDDASLYRGIFGQGDYVLDVGNKFAATIIDNNTVRIMDGDLVIQGHQARIRANDYEEVTIDNGTPGEKRNDLIVARYQKNTTTGIESITLEVVKGTPGATAVDPDIVQEDLATDGTQRDFPLYRVSLNGLVLESVTSLFTVLPNFEDFMTHQAENVSQEFPQNPHGVPDYEKGTWTPEYIPESGSFSSIVYGEQAGRYLKFGNMCFIQMRIATSSLSLGNASGDLRIRGLPFPYAYDINGLSIGFIRKFGSSATEKPTYARIVNGPYITIGYNRPNEQEANYMQASMLSTSSVGAYNNDLIISGWYRVP